MLDFTCAHLALARCNATSSPYVGLSSFHRVLVCANSVSFSAVIITSRVCAYFEPGRSAASTIHAAPSARSRGTPSPLKYISPKLNSAGLYAHDAATLYIVTAWA